MSFRSRSRTTQPLPTTRRRSLSSSRAQCNGSYNFGGSSTNGYSSIASRPLSTGYYQNGVVANGSFYQSPYASSVYNPRDNLYATASTVSAGGGRNDYYSNGNGLNHYRQDNCKVNQQKQPNHQLLHHHVFTVAFLPSSASASASGAYLNNTTAGASTSYMPSSSSILSSSNNKHNSKNPTKTVKSYLRSAPSSQESLINSKPSISSSSLSSSSAYSASSILSNSVYGNVVNQCNIEVNSKISISSAASNVYEPQSSSSRYTTNTNTQYSSDRYSHPYASTYDNGVTTASLSFNMGSSKNGSGTTSLTKSNSFKIPHSYSQTAGRSLHKSLSSSSSNLNTYHHPPANVNGTITGTSSASVAAAIVSRSNSLREQERKSRTRSRSRSAAQRSLSASSEKSEGYESGGESRQPSRSRLTGMTSSSTPSASSNCASDEKKSSEKSESVDNVDYKALWEAVKMENEKLKQQLKKKDEEIIQTRATLERLANATTKNSLSEIEKRERRTMERKLSELEEELKFH
uniref:cGMP-dependent protein kinase interacting domain-containing protein n=1 Tax=Glossina brevipalpis TaxID=37001 RepID=A0A1A9WD17_9MUSC